MQPIKTLKNGPQKLLIIGPNPFISHSSPDHNPQPRIYLTYYEISGPNICSLICAFKVSRFRTKVVRKSRTWMTFLFKMYHFHKGVCYNVWCTLFHRKNKVSLRLHYNFFGQILKSYFKCIMQKSLKWGIVGLCTSYFENMRADFVLRYQKLTSQSTP